MFCNTTLFGMAKTKNGIPLISTRRHDTTTSMPCSLGHISYYRRGCAVCNQPGMVCTHRHWQKQLLPDIGSQARRSMWYCLPVDLIFSNPYVLDAASSTNKGLRKGTGTLSRRRHGRRPGLREAYPLHRSQRRSAFNATPDIISACRAAPYFTLRRSIVLEPF